MSSFACPHCGKRYAFREGMAGRKAKCGQCGAAFVIAAPQPAAVLNTAAAGPIASSVAQNVVASGGSSAVAPAAPQPAMVTQGVPVGLPVGYPAATSAGMPTGVPIGMPFGVPAGGPLGAPGSPASAGMGVPWGPIPATAGMQGAIGMAAAPGAPFGVPGQPTGFPAAPLGGLDGLLAADAGAASPLAMPAATGPMPGLQPVRYRRKANVPWKWIGLGTGAGAGVVLLIYLVYLVATGIGNATSSGPGGGGMFGGGSRNTQEADRVVNQMLRVQRDILGALQSVRDPQSVQQGVVKVRALVDEFEKLLQQGKDLDRRRVNPSREVAQRATQEVLQVNSQIRSEAMRVGAIPGAQQLMPEFERLERAAQNARAGRGP